MMVEERIAERRAAVRASRRRARLRRTLLVTFLIVIVAAGAVFERSEHATLRDVSVVGTVRLDRSSVVDASGVLVGESAVRVWTPRVADRVEGLTLVRSAQVSRQGLRALIITVEEREPVYSAVHRGVSVLVDRDGVIVDTGRDDRLPVVRLITPPPQPGELVASHAALSNAHRVWTGLSGPLRSRVLEVRAPDEDGLELILIDAPVVRFGRAEQLEDKVRAMGAILEDVAGSEITVIDVRVPGVPVFRID